MGQVFYPNLPTRFPAQPTIVTRATWAIKNFLIFQLLACAYCKMVNSMLFLQAKNKLINSLLGTIYRLLRKNKHQTKVILIKLLKLLIPAI